MLLNLRQLGRPLWRAKRTPLVELAEQAELCCSTYRTWNRGEE
jgi:hypothetical protein